MAYKFNPGDEVYVVERESDGTAIDSTGYMFIAEVGYFVIVSSYINDLETLSDTLDYHVDETRDNYETHLGVFPVCDCYESLELANAALTKEQES